MIEKVRPFITKQITKFRTPKLDPEVLAVTLPYLATGLIYEPLMYKFYIHRTTISQIIQDVCSASYKVLQPNYMNLRSSPQEWKAIANERYRRWNILNCLGAADGKHIAILKPKHAGYDFYNYEGFYGVSYWNSLTMIIIFWQLLLEFKFELVMVVCSRILQCILP